MSLCTTSLLAANARISCGFSTLDYAKESTYFEVSIRTRESFSNGIPHNIITHQQRPNEQTNKPKQNTKANKQKYKKTNKRQKKTQTNQQPETHEHQQTTTTTQKGRANNTRRESGRKRAQVRRMTGQVRSGRSVALGEGGWVLQTAGGRWIYRQVVSGCISSVRALLLCYRGKRRE